MTSVWHPDPLALCAIHPSSPDQLRVVTIDLHLANLVTFAPRFETPEK